MACAEPVYREHFLAAASDHEVVPVGVVGAAAEAVAVVRWKLAAVLAHLPSGVFTANAAWLLLAVIAFNLTRAAASLTDPQLAKANRRRDHPLMVIGQTLVSVPPLIVS